MRIKYKKLNDLAQISYSRAGDAGLDLVAVSKDWNEESGVLIFGTGLSVEIPPGHVGFLVPRSSVFKTGLSLANNIGIIDQNFRGEIKAIFYPGNRPKENYSVGDRIAQLIVMPIPNVELELTDTLSETNRNEQGFGSSGR